ncbi:MAG TPA: ABC transporter ATP-binding protein [Candidatus Dormibacteraeota bacterium]|nr:ABC transporter ATP-binding protein [Candidatus Dormibacteraeota bacterium]
MSEALRVRGLTVSVGGLEVVRGVSFGLERGGRTGLIGESGSGKTLTALAIMGLLADGLTARGEVRLGEEDLMRLPERRLCRLRGDRLAMVFQEPMTALNPVMRIGDQVAEPFRVHRGLSRREAHARGLELLERVRIQDAQSKLGAYPHQLSGGQRQRVMIAIAMACSPEVLLADEPTTALDVTVQAQVLDLLSRLVDEERCTLLLITHDLPVVSQLCDRVLVMYGGRIVEAGPAGEVFGRPLHPYTGGLIETIPPLDEELPGRRFRAIPGVVPGAGEFPAGCPFRNRCARADERCVEMPPLTGDGHQAACWHPL